MYSAIVADGLSLASLLAKEVFDKKDFHRFIDVQLPNFPVRGSGSVTNGDYESCEFGSGLIGALTTTFDSRRMVPSLFFPAVTSSRQTPGLSLRFEPAPLRALGFFSLETLVTDR